MRTVRASRRYGRCADGYSDRSGAPVSFASTINAHRIRYYFRERRYARTITYRHADVSRVICGKRDDLYIEGLRLQKDRIEIPIELTFHTMVNRSKLFQVILSREFVLQIFMGREMFDGVP